ATSSEPSPSAYWSTRPAYPGTSVGSAVIVVYHHSLIASRAAWASSSAPLLAAPCSDSVVSSCSIESSARPSLAAVPSLVNVVQPPRTAIVSSARGMRRITRARLPRAVSPGSTTGRRREQLLQEPDEELGRVAAAGERHDELLLVLFVLGVAGQALEAGLVRE